MVTLQEFQEPVSTDSLLKTHHHPLLYDKGFTWPWKLKKTKHFFRCDTTHFNGDFNKDCTLRLPVVGRFSKHWSSWDLPWKWTGRLLLTSTSYALAAIIYIVSSLVFWINTIFSFERNMPGVSPELHREEFDLCTFWVYIWGLALLWSWQDLCRSEVMERVERELKNEVPECLFYLFVF